MPYAVTHSESKGKGGEKKKSLRRQSLCLNEMVVVGRVKEEEEKG